MSQLSLGVFKANRAHKPVRDDEIPVKKDDLLYLIEEPSLDDPSRWKMKLKMASRTENGPTGFVPADCLLPVNVHSVGIALQDYFIDGSSQALINKDDLLDVIAVEDDWILVRQQEDDGHVGFVPRSHVLLDEEKGPLAISPSAASGLGLHNSFPGSSAPNINVNPSNASLLAPKSITSSQAMVNYVHEAKGSDLMTCIAISPRGANTMASGARNGQIFVWSAMPAYTMLIKQMRGHTGPVHSIAFVGQGGSVVSCSADRSVRISSLSSGVPQVFLGHESSVHAVAVSHDGQWMVSGSDDGSVIVWEVKRKQPAHRSRNHSTPVRSVAFAPNGKMVASGALDGSVILSDITGTSIYTLDGHAGLVRSIAFSPGGDTVASTGGDGCLRLWSVNDGDELFCIEGYGHLVFAPDGRSLAMAWASDTVSILDLSGNRDTRYAVGLPTDIGAITYVRAGTALVFASYDGTVQELNVLNGSVTYMIHGLHESLMGTFTAANRVNAVPSQPPSSTSPPVTSLSIKKGAHSPAGSEPMHSTYSTQSADRRDDLIINSAHAGETLAKDLDHGRAANIFQKWLDDNIDHPQRHLIIKKLVDFASENEDDLPTALFISGVYIDSDAAPVASGSFADVFRGKYADQDVAVKRFRVFMSEDGKDKLYKRFYREALIWRQLRHPRVLAFLGVDKDALRSKGTLNMVSPWMTQGALMEYLAQVGASPIPHKSLIMDVANGLEYLHAQTFAHGDLHGSNVFIDGQGRALLGDFGLTAVTDMAHLAATTTVNKAGAIRWLAPELVHYDDGPPPRKTMSGDVFAFGRICLSIYTRSVPFYPILSDAGIVMKVMMHQHPSKPTLDECHGARLPDDLWDIINKCWNSDVDVRPTISDVVTLLNREAF